MYTPRQGAGIILVTYLNNDIDYSNVTELHDRSTIMELMLSSEYKEIYIVHEAIFNQEISIRFNNVDNAVASILSCKT